MTYKVEYTMKSGTEASVILDEKKAVKLFTSLSNNAECQRVSFSLAKPRL